MKHSSSRLVSMSILAACTFAFAPELGARMADENSGPCVICHEDCPTGEHVAANGGYTLPLTWKREGGAHTGFACLPGTCEANHGPSGCGAGMIQQTDIEQVRLAAKRGDEGKVGSLVRSYPTNIAWNGTRNAVQIRDCLGGLMAHFPIGIGEGA